MERVQDAELQRILLETKASHDIPKALTTCTGSLRTLLATMRH